MSSLDNPSLVLANETPDVLRDLSPTTSVKVTPTVMVNEHVCQTPIMTAPALAERAVMEKDTPVACTLFDFPIPTTPATTPSLVTRGPGPYDPREPMPYPPSMPPPPHSVTCHGDLCWIVTTKSEKSIPTYYPPQPHPFTCDGDVCWIAPTKTRHTAQHLTRWTTVPAYVTKAAKHPKKNAGVSAKSNPLTTMRHVMLAMLLGLVVAPVLAAPTADKSSTGLSTPTLSEPSSTISTGPMTDTAIREEVTGSPTIINNKVTSLPIGPIHVDEFAFPPYWLDCDLDDLDSPPCDEDFPPWLGKFSDSTFPTGPGPVIIDELPPVTSALSKSTIPVIVDELPPVTSALSQSTIPTTPTTTPTLVPVAARGVPPLWNIVGDEESTTSSTSSTSAANATSTGKHEDRKDNGASARPGLLTYYQHVVAAMLIGVGFVLPY